LPIRYTRILILSAAFLTPMLVRPAEAMPPRVEWVSDFELGLEEAVLTRRPVLLTFYTTWCSWCRTLESRTFRDPEFVETARAHFVSVRVDGDKERGLAAMYRVNGYPTTVLLSRRGKEIGRVVGYKPPGEFLQLMMAAMGRREPLKEAMARAQANPTDPMAAYELGDVLLALGRHEDAARAFLEVGELDRGGEAGLADDAALDIALTLQLAGEHARALEAFELFMKNHPRSDRMDQGRYFYGLALLKVGREAEGREQIREAAETTSLSYIRLAAENLEIE
jgi:thiol:disulfide interchange protein DsbD